MSGFQCSFVNIAFYPGNALCSSEVFMWMAIPEYKRSPGKFGMLSPSLVCYSTPNFSPPIFSSPLSCQYRGLKIFPTLLIRGFFHFWCCKWYFCKHRPQQTNHCWRLIVINFKRPLLEKLASDSERLKYPLKIIYFPRWIQEVVMLRERKKHCDLRKTEFRRLWYIFIKTQITWIS